ncbi:unnamed protein product, partial [Tenebrio molitor]
MFSPSSSPLSYTLLGLPLYSLLCFVRHIHCLVLSCTPFHLSSFHCYESSIPFHLLYFFNTTVSYQPPSVYNLCW